MLLFGSKTLFPISKQIRRPHIVAFCVCCKWEASQLHWRLLIQIVEGENGCICSFTFSKCTVEDDICMYITSRLLKTQTKATKSLIHLWFWKSWSFSCFFHTRSSFECWIEEILNFCGLENTSDILEFQKLFYFPTHSYLLKEYI